MMLLFRSAVSKSVRMRWLRLEQNRALDLSFLGGNKHTQDFLVVPPFQKLLLMLRTYFDENERGAEELLS